MQVHLYSGQINMTINMTMSNGHGIKNSGRGPRPLLWFRWKDHPFDPTNRPSPFVSTRGIHHPLLPCAVIFCLCPTAQLLDDETKVLLPAFGPFLLNPTRQVVLTADRSCYTSCRSIDDGSTQFFERKWQL